MARRLCKWALALALMTGFLGIAFNLKWLSWLDSGAYDWFCQRRTPFLNGFFMLMSAMVNPLALLAFTLGLLLLVRRRSYCVPILANLGISVILNLGLKSEFTRARPTELSRLVEPSGYSFPSGHAMASAAFYGFALVLVWQSNLKKWWKLLLTIALGLIVCLVGISRVYLGAHYLTDVLAAWCVSGAYLILFSSFVRSYFQGRQSVSEKLARFKRGSLLRSFGYAIDGILSGLKEERNMIIHFGAATAVIVFGVLVRLSAAEWMICLLLCGFVLAAELFNTAIEATVDLCMPEEHPKAKLAKDIAAGAVLVVALTAALVGLVIFGPKLWTSLMTELGR